MSYLVAVMLMFGWPGKHFTLLPLKDRDARSGRAHTKNFVPLGSAVSIDEGGRERKGG